MRQLRVTTLTIALSIAVGPSACVTPGVPRSSGVRQEEVQFANGGVRLVGTLVLPESNGRYPAVVLVHGSGAEARDMYLRHYARTFAGAGIAALAFDKRGAGQSTKVSARAPYDTLAGDVLAAVELLKRHPSIDSSQIGLWGLSEGEWVAPLAASRMSHPAFLILASASSMTPAEQVRTEVGRLLRAKGYPDTTVALARGLYARISEFERTGNGRDELNGALGRVANAEWFKDAKYLSASVPDHTALLKAAWFRTWRANMDFDALPILRALDCPVLVLLGGKDLKYDPALTVARYTDALGGKPNRQFAVKVFPNATHAMVEWWLPLHVPPPRYPAGYFDLQREWIRSSLLGR